ncbi:unnamed protein product, partial [Adineta steineri]
MYGTQKEDIYETPVTTTALTNNQ